MAKIRTFMEMRPAEVTPVMRRFEPFENVRLLRWRWFNWFWLGDSKGDVGNYTILIGPFVTKRGARRAWDNPFLKKKERVQKELLRQWMDEDIDEGDAHDNE
jgi:hypothetical protein